MFIIYICYFTLKKSIYVSKNNKINISLTDYNKTLINLFPYCLLDYNKKFQYYSFATSSVFVSSVKGIWHCAKI